jgi:hypothetical protein
VLRDNGLVPRNARRAAGRRARASARARVHRVGAGARAPLKIVLVRAGGAAPATRPPPAARNPSFLNPTCAVFFSQHFSPARPPLGQLGQLAQLLNTRKTWVPAARLSAEHFEPEFRRPSVSKAMPKVPKEREVRGNGSGLALVPVF